MNNSREKIKHGKNVKSFIDTMEHLHPYYIISGLSAFIVTVFFIYFLYDLTIGIIRSGGLPGILLPRILFPGSFLLILSAIPIYRIVIHFENEEFRKLGMSLAIIVLTGVIFIGLQLTALSELIKHNTGTTHPLILRDLVVILLFHLTGVLFVFFYSFFKLSNLLIIKHDPVKRLIYFTNILEKIRLNLLKYIWIYTGYLWLFLYVYLLMIL